MPPTSLGFELAFLNSEADPFFASVRRDSAELLLKAPDTSVLPLPTASVIPWRAGTPS